MYRLTQISRKQRSVVMPLTILIALGGIFGVTRLLSKLLPNIEIPILTVIAVNPDAGPETVDSTISQPLSQDLKGIQEMKAVTTQSSKGFSVVIAEVDYGQDMANRQDKVSQTLTNVRLPADVQAPKIQRINLQQFPVIQLALTSEDGDLAKLRQMADAGFKPVSRVRKVSAG